MGTLAETQDHVRSVGELGTARCVGWACGRRRWHVEELGTVRCHGWGFIAEWDRITGRLGGWEVGRLGGWGAKAPMLGWSGKNDDEMAANVRARVGDLRDGTIRGNTK